MKAMGNKVFGNVLWRFFERAGAQLIQLCVTIVLARILGPEAFGNVAIMTAIVSILQVLVDGGLASALIQKKDADETDYSSAFYFNIIFCVFLYAILFLCAPLVSAFYNNDDFTLWIRVVGILIIISGVKNVQQSIVAKRLEFKKFFFSTISGTVMAAFIGIWMAVKGAGVWALIAQLLTNSFVDTIVVSFTLGWKPSKVFSLQRTKALWQYGWKILLSNLIDVFFGNYIQLMIGKRYSVDDLAYYNRGKSLPHVIVSNINTSIDSVLFPVMSIEQNDRDRIKSITQKAIISSTFIMAPLMMGMFFTADLIVKVLLGMKWMPSVTYIRVFCVILLFQPIHTANTNVLKAMGKSEKVLNIEIIKKVIGIVVLSISMLFSMKVLVFTYMFYTFLNQFINSYPNKKLIGYSYFDQVRDVIPSILLSIIMGAVVAFIHFPDEYMVPALIVKIICGIVIYYAGTRFFNREALRLVENMIHGRKE